VQAICAWVHNNIEYRYGSGRPDLSASEAIEQRYGVCRDFAHVVWLFAGRPNDPREDQSVQTCQNGVGERLLDALALREIGAKGAQRFAYHSEAIYYPIVFLYPFIPRT
jgi:hypothetical protein